MCSQSVVHCLESTQQGDLLTKLTKLPSLERHQKSHVNLLRSNSISGFTSIPPPKFNSSPLKNDELEDEKSFLLGWLSLFRGYSLLNLQGVVDGFSTHFSGMKIMRGPLVPRRRNRRREEAKVQSSSRMGLGGGFPGGSQVKTPGPFGKGPIQPDP